MFFTGVGDNQNRAKSRIGLKLNKRPEVTLFVGHVRRLLFANALVRAIYKVIINKHCLLACFEILLAI